MTERLSQLASVSRGMKKVGLRGPRNRCSSKWFEHRALATTMESLAAQSDLPNYPEDELRVINGLYSKGEPEPGQLIKIID